MTVIALDVGTSSVRASVCDDAGQVQGGRFHREPLRPTVTPDGGVEHDPARLLETVATCLDAVLVGPRMPDVAAVGIATFWHGLLGFDATGQALTPIFMGRHPQRRRRPAAARGARRALLHARTGCHVHASYWPAKLRWLFRERAAEMTRVARWGSFGEYLELNLFGETATSVSMASGTGLFDQDAQRWDAERWPPRSWSRHGCSRCAIAATVVGGCARRGHAAGQRCGAPSGSRRWAMAPPATSARAASIRSGWPSTSGPRRPCG